MTWLPNAITMLRIVLIPVFAYYWLNGSAMGMFVGACAFIVASVSDWFDGYLARRWQVVSNFGKIADPLADKLLVQTALFIFWHQGWLPLWVALVVLVREIAVTILRGIRLKQGIVIAAGWAGKAKTFMLMCGQVAIVIFGSLNYFGYNISAYTATAQEISYWFFTAGAVITIISAIPYFTTRRKNA